MKKASLFTIFLIVFIDLVGFGIVLPNLQLYGQQYGISNYFYLTLIGATYSFFQFIFAPILGRWSDRIGRRPVLLISQLGTLIGFLVLFSANEFRGQALGIVLIFVSRMIDGISGGNISTANAYIADITTPENRAKGMGVIGAAFGLGFVCGPLIGAGVSKFFGLEYVPLAACMFTIVALTMTWLKLAESRQPNAMKNDAAARRFSFRGLQHTLARPIIGPLILLFFINGFAFAGMEQTLSLLIQHRLFPMHQPVRTSDSGAARTQRNSVAIAAPFPVAPADAQVFSNSPQAIAFRKKQDSRVSVATGLLFGAIGVMMVLIQGGMIGRLTKKYGELALAIVGPFIISAGLVVIAIPVHWAWKWTGFLSGGLLLAIGAGIFNPAMQSLISRHCAPDEQGEVLGANQGMASLARCVGPILAGLLFEYLFPASPYYLSASLCLIVTLLVLLKRDQFRLPASVAAERQAALQSK